MGTKATVREWGNSVGIVLPKKLVEERQLEPGDEIVVEVTKKLDMNDVFGAINTGMTGQEFKDEARSEW